MKTSYKISVCGSGGVGRSCITGQFVKNEFYEDFDPTVEDEYETTWRGRILRITDVAGWEEKYYIGPPPFKLDVPSELRSIKLAHENPPIVLVGNKLDQEDDRVVERHVAEAYARDHGMPYVEASAKERVNIDEIFDRLIEHAGFPESTTVNAASNRRRTGCTVL